MSCDCGETSSNRSRIFADDNDFQNAATMQRGDARAAEVARMQREWNDVINQQREADSGRNEVSRRDVGRGVVVSEDGWDEEGQRAVRGTRTRADHTVRMDRTVRMDVEDDMHNFDMDGQYAGQWCGGARAQCNAEYAGQLNNNESVQEQYNEQGEIMYDANNADMREFLSDVYVAEYMIAYNDSRHEIVQQYMGHLAEVADNIEFDARSNTYTANNIVYFAEYDLIFDANAELFTDGINTIALQDLMEEHDMYDGHDPVPEGTAPVATSKVAGLRSLFGGIVDKARTAAGALANKATTAANEVANKAAAGFADARQQLSAVASQVANSAGEAVKQGMALAKDAAGKVPIKQLATAALSAAALAGGPATMLLAGPAINAIKTGSVAKLADDFSKKATSAASNGFGVMDVAKLAAQNPKVAVAAMRM